LPVPGFCSHEYGDFLILMRSIVSVMGSDHEKKSFYPYYDGDLYMCVYYCMPEAISLDNHQRFTSQIDCCLVFLPMEFSEGLF
jgi:hypothetical protein